jgi:L-alanine-DL-glutamate epimerase-like enolase superfamily enzyme
MKVTAIETLSCDAGWRDYKFVKLTTDGGIVGWSEFAEGFGSPGVEAVIHRLAPRVVGQPVGEHERIYADLYSATRPGAGSVIGQALGAIENALLDAKARALGVPCYELLGGKMRDRLRVYWSHCATWRINHPTWYKPAITDLDGVKAIGREVREKGFTALKTNIFLYEPGGCNPKGWRPGFGAPFQPEINVDRAVLRNLRLHLEALREGAGPDVDFLLDLNFNAKTEGYLRILRDIAGLDMFWVEIDTFSPEALGYIRRQSPHAIASCETLMNLRAFLPYFREQAVDVAIVDVPWNGAWQSMKVAAAAEAHEVNVAPHNFYGHLCTMMAAHFCAAVPNFRIMETDLDRLAWDDELVTHPPVFQDGHLVLPDRPGWGTEPNEEALRAHPPKGPTGLLDYGRGQTRRGCPPSGGVHPRGAAPRPTTSIVAHRLGPL